MNPALLSVIIANLPGIIRETREAFTTQHPDEPVPTEAEVMAGYHEAITTSLATDAEWLAAHPRTDE